MSAEEILRNLAECFYIDFDGNIRWSFVDTVSIDEINHELANAFLEYFPESEKLDFKPNNPDQE